MIVRVTVQIENEPNDHYGYASGSINFAESAKFDGAGFETVSKIFTRCHELLETMKAEHQKARA